MDTSLAELHTYRRSRHLKARGLVVYLGRNRGECFTVRHNGRQRTAYFFIRHEGTIVLFEQPVDPSVEIERLVQFLREEIVQCLNSNPSTAS